MLVSLRVRDLVLIEKLDQELLPGFNVLTGETGAGKSILVEAISLALGARGRSQLVRAGSDGAEVEALFDIRDEPAVRARLEEAGWGDAEELLVRRGVGTEGRSRAWVNGHQVPQSMLAELARGLAELSSQHEHHALADPATHLYSLDAFGRLEKRRQETAEAHAAVVGAIQELRRLRDLGNERESRLEILGHRLAELDALRPERGEEESIRSELEILRSSAKLLDTARSGEAALYSDEGATVEVLDRVMTRLKDAARIDPALRPLESQLEEIRALVEDVADQMRRYADRLDADPELLARLEERLAGYARARRLLGGADADLAERWDELRAEREAVESHESLEAEAAARVDSALAEAAELARALSGRRKAAARKLSRAFRLELADLGMGQAQIEVRVEPAAGGEPSVDGARLSATGIDHVEFLISSNPGEPARPLRKIASGGELSRAALALKRALAGVGPVGTYVFDEVDAGISGAVADMVGRKLREVSRHHQVLCVTHLPQVAALADSHFLVRKRRRGKRTVTEVVRLDDAGRVEEIARMLSGSKVTDRARAAAAELLDGR